MVSSGGIKRVVCIHVSKSGPDYSLLDTLGRFLPFFVKAGQIL